MPVNFENSAGATELEKVNFIPIPKKSKRQRREGKIYPFECRVPVRKPPSVINAKK